MHSAADWIVCDDMMVGSLAHTDFDGTHFFDGHRANHHHKHNNAAAYKADHSNFTADAVAKQAAEFCTTISRCANDHHNHNNAAAYKTHHFIFTADAVAKVATYFCTTISRACCPPLQPTWQIMMKLLRRPQQAAYVYSEGALALAITP